MSHETIEKMKDHLESAYDELIKCECGIVELLGYTDSLTITPEFKLHLVNLIQSITRELDILERHKKLLVEDLDTLDGAFQDAERKN